MGKLTRLANINDLTEGSIKNFQVQGIDILIARILCCPEQMPSSRWRPFQRQIGGNHRNLSSTRLSI
jgi:hypothetical protein